MYYCLRGGSRILKFSDSLFCDCFNLFFLLSLELPEKVLNFWLGGVNSTSSKDVLDAKAFYLENIRLMLQKSDEKTTWDA